MDDLWQVIAELSIRLNPDRVESVAAAIENLSSSSDIGSVRQAFGPNLETGLWDRLVTCWSDCPDIDSRSVSAGLRAGCRAGALRGDGQTVSLVWTGPNTSLVPVRSTEQVMLEVIQGARVDLFLVSFVNVGANVIVAGLNEAANRGVTIRMLLEETKGAADNMRTAVPGAQIYTWTRALKIEYGSPPEATVHAKCMVADGNVAFITSANLTDWALEKNMELGVHFIGGREPGMLEKHLMALISTERITEFE